ncbi:MAG: PAS domain S-box protein, partial [Myxococcales bacterium]
MSPPSFDIERFREAAQFAPVGLFLTDATGQCLWVNDAWCELAGMSLEEALGMGWTRAIHPEDLERVRTVWRGRVTEVTSGKSEYRLQRADGQVRWVEASSRRLQGEQGELRGHVGSLVDISQRRRHEEALHHRE